MPTLSIQSVSKVYGGSVVALDHVDLELQGAQILGVVGPSGSGKSTLLRIIAGLEPLTSGHVALDGQIIDSLAPRDREVALMFQEHTLFPHMTVEGNLGFGLRVRGASRDEIATRIGDAARTLGLESLLARYPDQLSGGERQRVALGRALVRRPKLLLLDEPLSSVDAQLRGQLRGEIARTCRMLGAVLIFVTHDQMDAMAIADRIAVMRRGRIEQIGEAAALYDRPANRFVAEFIGLHGMNMFDGRIEHDGSRVRFVHDAFALDVAPAWHARLGTAAAVTLGIRPEGLRTVPSSGASPMPTIEATVETIERLGPQAFAHLTIAGRRYTAVADLHGSTKAGTPVGVVLDDAAIQFFDPEGRAL